MGIGDYIWCRENSREFVLSTSVWDYMMPPYENAPTSLSGSERHRSSGQEAATVMQAMVQRMNGGLADVTAQRQATREDEEAEAVPVER